MDNTIKGLIQSLQRDYKDKDQIIVYTIYCEGDVEGAYTPESREYWENIAAPALNGAMEYAQQDLNYALGDIASEHGWQQEEEEEDE